MEVAQSIPSFMIQISYWATIACFRKVANFYGLYALPQPCLPLQCACVTTVLICCSSCYHGQSDAMLPNIILNYFPIRAMLIILHFLRRLPEKFMQLAIYNLINQHHIFLFLTFEMSKLAFHSTIIHGSGFNCGSQNFILAIYGHYIIMMALHRCVIFLE